VVNKKRVLYIEDNEMSLRFIREIFKRRKYMELLVARNGEEGIEIAIKEMPDLILMDINLPGINGDEAMSILKSDPNTKHIPVVALTANAMQHDIDGGILAGFDEYLTKPLKITQLEAMLNIQFTIDTAY
jgi:CheY-like chemotaxis protein